MFHLFVIFCSVSTYTVNMTIPFGVRKCSSLDDTVYGKFHSFTNSSLWMELSCHFFQEVFPDLIKWCSIYESLDTCNFLEETAYHIGNSLFSGQSPHGMAGSTKAGLMSCCQHPEHPLTYSGHHK